MNCRPLPNLIQLTFFSYLAFAVALELFEPPLVEFKQFAVVGCFVCCFAALIGNWLFLPSKL
ncbi:MAG: hypothetical protein QGF46_07060, partial [Planctomycetota bacterium]|nr:hypothetical protein [Planctomycetota bacterium]